MTSRQFRNRRSHLLRRSLLRPLWISANVHSDNKEQSSMRKDQLTTTILQHTTLLLVFMAVVLAPLCGQAQVYASEQLFKMGQDAYSGYDFVAASVYLYAYMQKTPDLAATQPQHAAEVQKAYEYSVDKVRHALTERDNLKKQLA